VQRIASPGRSRRPVHAAPGSNTHPLALHIRVLVGSQVDELVLAGLLAIGDHVEHLAPVELAARVLQPVGHHHEHDLVDRTVARIEEAVDRKDRRADRVVERRAATRLVARVVQIGHLGDGHRSARMVDLACRTA
jgi:hypothetical protein